MHQFDGGGEQRFQSVFEDGMGMSAADFHDFDGAIAILSQLLTQNFDFVEESVGFLGIAEFLNVSHGGWWMVTCGW
jgi:hypothetical protein